MAKATTPAPTSEKIIIAPLQMRTVTVTISGTTPYMQNRFSEKAKNAIADKQRQGSQAGSKKKRDARDFEADFKRAFYQFKGKKGGYGIPATAFRNACISACKVAGVMMTRAKLSIFVEADGYDATDGTPLVSLKGTPHMNISPVRNDSGVIDLRSRPVWNEWTADVRIKFDEGQFSATDVVNLLARAGGQVGIGEGRPDSKNSNGIQYGLFELKV